MTTNPFINAGAATLYIAGVVSFIFYGLPQGPDPDTILMPLTVLSLLVLSVLVMGYCFLLTPAQMYLDGKKKEAVTLFMHSMGVFALITATFLLTLTLAFR
ncbi:MAG: hypothetical protein V4474_04290 [Patescibacteria group bacterium]